MLLIKQSTLQKINKRNFVESFQSYLSNLNKEQSFCKTIDALFFLMKKTTNTLLGKLRYFQSLMLFLIKFKMQSRLDKQEKLYYKNKVSDIINSYQKQKQEEEKQKILIKKQIMLSIMNNRQKPQTEIINKQKSQLSKQEKTQKTNLSEQALFDLNVQENKSIHKSNMYQPQLNLDTKYQSQLNKKPQNLQDITFNAKKRNKSLEQEPSFKESYLNLLKERRQRQQEQQYQNRMKTSMKYQQQPQNYPQVQKSHYKSSNQDQQDHQDKQARWQEQQSYYPNYTKYSQIKESLPYAKSKTEISSPSKEQRYQPSQKSQKSQEQRQQQEPKGVFLTMMGESESMVADQPPKNITFQIKMDKSSNPNDFEELKKQKIKQIQRKRQERIQQFRRNQSQKKVQMPKGKNSYSKKPQKQQNNQSDIPPPPRSVTVQRKNNDKNIQKNEVKLEKEPINKNLIPLESHESIYNMKPKNLKPIPNNNSYYNELQQKPPSYKHIHANYEQKQLKPKSPFKTPKSIMSQNNRAKSNNKNTNIFTIDNEPQRQKSSNKYAQPKIEPKDRKNSFTRQSNKKLMINAITHVIFPGQLNRKERERLIEIIQASQYEFFIFLFKEYSRKMIKGIYVFDSTQVYLRKIYGQKSPSEITAEMVQQFYRFDSGSRQFKKVDGCKSFSLSIHAIDLRK